MKIESTLVNREGQTLRVVYKEENPLKDLQGKILQGVHAFCFYKDKMVVVYAETKKFWSPPGGGIEEGETYQEAVIREVLEESNMKVLHQELIGYQDIHELNRIVRQTRSFCVVEPLGEFTSDPSGEITERKLIGPKDYKQYFDWGTIGERLMQKALEMKNEYDNLEGHASDMEDTSNLLQPLPEGYAYGPEDNLWYVLSAEAFRDLPEAVELEGETFLKKDEFHVTVANVRHLVDELAQTNKEDVVTKETIQNIFAEYLQNNSILFNGFEDDLRLAIKDERKSIAARCRVSGIQGFFDLIKEKYGREFPLQPAHVSLYTINGMAVGINSDDEMNSYEKINLPEVQQVLNSI